MASADGFAATGILGFRSTSVLSMKKLVLFQRKLSSLLKIKQNEKYTFIPGTYHFHFEHHQVCYSGKQTEDRWSDGCPSKCQPRNEHIIEHHRCPNTASQVPPNIYLCMYHICLSKGLPYLYEASGNTHNGLWGCHYNQYIITRYTPSWRA